MFTSRAHIDAHPAFEAWWSKVQKGAEMLLLIILVGGLCGAFGDGWLANASSPVAGTGVVVDYQRLLRNMQDTQLELHIAAAPGEGTATILLGPEMLRAMQVGTIVPRPESQRATPDGIAYTFAVAPRQPAQITLRLSPTRPGLIRSMLGYQGAQLAFSQFVYP